jgi:curli biogenesis system outer membrane secretion channel CsgG
MADMLSDALLQSNRFIVLDRQALQDVLQEHDLAAGGQISRETVRLRDKLKARIFSSRDR